MVPENTVLLKNQPKTKIYVTRQTFESTHRGSYNSFCPQITAAIKAGLCATASGSALSWPNPILNELKNGSYNSLFIDDNEISWITSSATIGAILMCIPAGIICDICGRKKTLMLMSIPLLFGWLLMLFGRSLWHLYAGRMLAGIGIGGTCVATPLYLSEIAHKSKRGFLGTIYQVMFVVGILWSYCSGAVLTLFPYTLSCASLPLVFLLFFCSQPESPIYFMTLGRSEAARRALQNLRGENYNINLELALLEMTVKETQRRTRILGLRNKPLKKGFIIGISLMVFQQFCGVNSVILYSSNTLQEFGTILNSHYHLIYIASCQIVATCVSSFLTDSIGRRNLLITSLYLTSFSTAFLGLHFSLAALLKNYSIYTWFFPTLGLCSFIIAFNLGLGPIPWMISTEIFSDEIRSKIISVIGTTSWLLAFLVSKFYPNVKDLIGTNFTFYGFSFFSLIGVLFVYLVVPETKGRSVLEIQILLER